MKDYVNKIKGEELEKVRAIIHKGNELLTHQIEKDKILTNQQIDKIEKLTRFRLEKEELGHFYRDTFFQRRTTSIAPDRSNFDALDKYDKADITVQSGWSIFDDYLADDGYISWENINNIKNVIKSELNCLGLGREVFVDTWWGWKPKFDTNLANKYITGNRNIEGTGWRGGGEFDCALESPSLFKFAPGHKNIESGAKNASSHERKVSSEGGSYADSESSDIGNLNSPMDQFEIKPFLGEFWGLNFTPLGLITNILVYIQLVVIFTYLFYMYATFKDTIRINGWSFSAEAIYFTIYNMVLGQIGSLVGLFFFILIFVLFIYILFSNLMGLIPYNFATTAHLVSTLSMSSSIWFGVTIIGLVLHALRFFTLFSPEGTPLLLVPLLALIELISYIAKGLSLGIRLGANLISGHLLLLILAGFGFLGLTATLGLRLTGGSVAIALITAISGLELAIAGIQSYVYSILTSSYIKDSVSLH